MFSPTSQNKIWKSNEKPMFNASASEFFRTCAVELALLHDFGLELWSHRDFLGADSYELTSVNDTLRSALQYPKGTTFSIYRK